MKRTFFLLFAALALNLTSAAQNDSTEITEWEDTVEEPVEENTHGRYQITHWFDGDGGNLLGSSIAVLGIIFTFPVLIVFIAFYFQYKNKRQRYRLVERAIASGQPIPEEFLRSGGNGDSLSKGIKNVCTGIGLFIFLWAITTNFAIGTIGLLIMFTGFAQIITYYAKSSDKNK